LQAWHAPVHAVPQQTLSMQIPLSHCAALAHVWPFTSLHAPALQIWFAAHVSCRSSAAATQVPRLPATLHAWQAAVHAPLQQTPSAQWTLKQSPSTPQIWPLMLLQVPMPLQTLFAGQVSCVPEPRFWQAPAALHATQSPLHAALQQTLSAQKPLRHSAAPAQGWPSTSLHAPSPSHCWIPPGAQLVPAATGVYSGVPPLHVSVVQTLLSFGRSIEKGTITAAPLPSHSGRMQSPSVMSVSGVPAATFIVPQVFAAHVATTHWVAPGHCEALLHCTHALAPSQ
jgi:hypothetical protein